MTHLEREQLEKRERNRRRLPWWRHDQFEALVDAGTSPWWAATLIKREILALRWEPVDLQLDACEASRVLGKNTLAKLPRGSDPPPWVRIPWDELVDRYAQAKPEAKP